MKYFIRSIKSVIYFAVIFLVIVTIMYLFSSQKSAGLRFSDMFQQGSLPKLAIFFVVFGATYPALSFFKRNLYSNKDYAEHKDLIVKSMEDLGYVVEKEDAESVSFRKRSFAQRMSRLFGEDRITITTTGNPMVVEGYRKDVMRIMSTISYKIRQAENPEEEA